MPSNLTPAQRVLRARTAALAMHAQGKTNTAPARANSPQAIPYWLKKVDPESELPEAERTRRAEYARRSHMAAMALKSSRVRANRRKKAAEA